MPNQEIQPIVTEQSPSAPSSVESEPGQGKNTEKDGDYNIRDLVLPSELQSLVKTVGSIYYNPAVKSRVLIPVHFWGSVAKAGLHFVPIETNLINGLSMAGGPTNEALMSKVKLTRKVNNEMVEENFDLTDGGDFKAFDFKLKPGDTIYIKRDEFNINRAWYTSLFGVVATILSSVLLYRQVEKSNGR